MKIKKEHDMTPSEIAASILPWAETLDNPIFTNRMAYVAIDCIGEPKDVSDALRYLFKQGKIARKMMDGARYAYALIDKAPDDFERAERAERLVKEPVTNDPVLLNSPAEAREAFKAMQRHFTQPPVITCQEPEPKPDIDDCAPNLIKKPAKERETALPFLTLHLADGKISIPEDQESPSTAKQESGKLSALDVCKDGLLEKIELIEVASHIAKRSAKEGQLTHALKYIDHAATQCQLDELLINVIKALDPPPQ